MQNFSVLLKKYSVPFLFSALGIVLIIVSLVTDQPFEFVLASIIILICSIFLFLTVSGSVSNKVTNIIGGVSLVLAGYAFYSAWGSVGTSIKHNSDYALMKGLAIQNLKDVQSAQKEYEKKYDVFAADWNTIIRFIENDSIADIVRKGSVPNRKINEAERDYLIQFGLYKRGQAIDNKMTDLEAYYLSKSDICPVELITFKRDTIMVSFIETTFTKNRGYLTEREQNNYGKFDAKKLRYIPFTKDKVEWNMDTIMKPVGEDTVCYFRLEGILPIAEIEGAKADEIMSLGSILEFNLSGSWEDEDIKQKIQLKK